MKKPWWEEAWELADNDPESGPVIGLQNGGVLFECNDATRARGAHAAPDMARALLEAIGAPNTFLPGHVEHAIRAALTKAGVPLP